MNKIEHADLMATAMRVAASDAAAAGKQAMVKVAEEAFPEECKTGGHRQIGAMITAASIIYADMVKACVNSGSKREAALVAGMLETMIAEPLKELAAQQRR